MPGFGLPIADVIERVGLEDARELWALSKEGADYVRATATEDLIPGISPSDGALEVSNVDVGEALISRLQTLAEDLATEVEGWQVDRVRSVLQDRPLFPRHLLSEGVPDRRPQICPRPRGAGDPGGRADLRGDAGGQHRLLRHPQAHRDAVGAAARQRTSCWRATSISARRCKRLSDTLLPVWRYAALTEPLGERLSEAIAFSGSVADSDGIDHFRIVDGDRPAVGQSRNHLERAAEAALAPRCSAASPRVFPQLGKVPIADMFGGAVGVTVHGMPQIGQLRKGLWVASGFGRQGLSYLGAGRAVDRAQHPVGRRPLAAVLAVRAGLGRRRHRPRRRPFRRPVDEGRLVRGGRAGALPRGRAPRSGVREARLAEANLKAGTRDRRPAVAPGAARPVPAPCRAAQAGDGEAPHPHASQESERVSDGRM